MQRVAPPFPPPSPSSFAVARNIGRRGDRSTGAAIGKRNVSTRRFLLLLSRPSSRTSSPRGPRPINDPVSIALRQNGRRITPARGVRESVVTRSPSDPGAFLRARNYRGHPRASPLPAPPSGRIPGFSLFLLDESSERRSTSSARRSRHDGLPPPPPTPPSGS